MKVEYDEYGACLKCKSTDVILNVKAREDSIISEVEVHCETCGDKNYWAYGFYERGEKYEI